MRDKLTVTDMELKDQIKELSKAYCEAIKTAIANKTKNWWWNKEIDDMHNKLNYLRIRLSIREGKI